MAKGYLTESIVHAENYSDDKLDDDDEQEEEGEEWKVNSDEILVGAGPKYSGDQLEMRWQDHLEREAYFHGPLQALHRGIVGCWEKRLRQLKKGSNYCNSNRPRQYGTCSVQNLFSYISGWKQGSGLQLTTKPVTG
ncbi:hypothetical protein B0H14DRAFT_2621859 [Mycena olivaceomarginata]|nr:hypothetical protein B0H14DRAFT_2621859 [Mycena olivaceomarginata]